MDRDLFVSWLREHQDAVSAMFHDREGLRRVAMAMAGSTPRAIDYIQQAPVIVLLMHASTSRRGLGIAPPVAEDFFFSHARPMLARIAQVSAPLLGSGHKLRRVMNLIWQGVPMGFQRLGLVDEPSSLYQLRALKAGALRHAYIGPVLLLAQINPSALAQALPRFETYQRSWLAFLAGWHTRLHNRAVGVAADPVTVEHLAAATGSEKYGLGAYEGGHLADYMIAARIAGVPHLRRGCTWRDLAEAIVEWGNGRDPAMMVEPMPRRRTPDAIADYSPLPNDPVTIGEYTFVPLRTPTDLADEGRAMRHCVANYVDDVFARSSFIYSVRLEQQRVATIEVLASSLGHGILWWVVSQFEGPKAANGKRTLDLPPSVRQAVAAFIGAQNERVELARPQR